MEKKRRIVYALVLACIFMFALPVSASAAKISKSSLTLFVGKKNTLRVTGTSAAIKWTSSKPSVATVSSKGVVTAKKKGTATIKATVNQKTYKCKVTVKQPVTKITLNKSSYFLMPGKTLQLKATVAPSNANNKKITWSSANKNIAKVSSSGKVTAVKNGTVNIVVKAKDGSGKSAVCKIMVLKSSASTSTAKPAATTTTAKPAASSKRQQLLAALEKYSNTIASETKSGKDWIYRNSNPSRLFSEAISSNNRVANCALIATWALKDIGVLGYKQTLWGESYGTIHYSGTGTEEAVKKGCDIIKANASVKDLVAAGKLIAGDICIYNFGSTGHTNVFNGYNKSTGIYNFYDAGRNGQNCVKGSDGNYHFKHLKQTSSSGSNIVSYIIRVK